MKKLLYIIVTLLIFIIAYFCYEFYAFNHYLDNTTQKDNMNIPINEDAPVKSRNQIEIEAPLDTVWSILTGIKDWPKWQKAVSETTVIGNVGEGTAFKWKADGLTFKSKIHTSIPKSAFGWTGTTIGASAIHNWTFREKDNSTIVIVEESLQGIFPKLFRSYFQKNLDKGVLTNLEELKAASEEMTK